MSVVPQIIVNSIIAGGTYALVALGFNLIYGTTKFFNLAHGAVVLIGAYAALCILKSFPGINVAAAIVAAVLAAGLAGYLLDKILYRTLRKQKASNTVLMVASLGALTFVQAVIAIIFTIEFQTLSGLGSQVYTAFGASITRTQVLILLCVFACACGLAILLKKTKFGVTVRAIGDDEEVSRIVGINTEKTIGRVFFIGSAVAGLAGVLSAFDTGVQPAMGLQILLGGIIASVIGGIGSIRGAVVGAFFLGFIENFGILAIPSEWKMAISFLALILFLMFRPQGIVKK